VEASPTQESRRWPGAGRGGKPGGARGVNGVMPGGTAGTVGASWFDKAGPGSTRLRRTSSPTWRWSKLSAFVQRFLSLRENRAQTSGGNGSGTGSPICGIGGISRYSAALSTDLGVGCGQVVEPCWIPDGAAEGASARSRRAGDAGSGDGLAEGTGEARVEDGAERTPRGPAGLTGRTTSSSSEDSMPLRTGVWTPAGRRRWRTGTGSSVGRLSEEDDVDSWSSQGRLGGCGLLGEVGDRTGYQRGRRSVASLPTSGSYCRGFGTSRYALRLRCPLARQ